MARLRTGLPFAGARVAVGPRRSGPMLPGMDGPFGPAQPTAVLDDGSFAIERVAPGPSPLVSLMVMGGAGGGVPWLADSPASRPRRARRRRRPRPHPRSARERTPHASWRASAKRHRLLRRSEPRRDIVLHRRSRLGACSRPRAPSRWLAWRLRADGSYELLVFEPGQYDAMLRTDGMSTPLRPGASRRPQVRRALRSSRSPTWRHASSTSPSELQRSQASWSRRNRRSQFRALSSAHHRQGRRGDGMTDAEGRFSFDLEPGEGQLRVNAQDFAPFDQSLTVAEGGTDGRRRALARPRDRRPCGGRGRPAARRGRRHRDRRKGHERLRAPLPDGTFRLRGLVDGAHNVLAGSSAIGFGFETGVSAGATGVVVACGRRRSCASAC